MKRSIRIAFLTAVALLLLLYIGDFLSLQLDLPKRPQLATVHVTPYLAVPHKDGKTEFILDTPYDETCVNALFPHFGHNPCWWVQRHQEKRENL